MVGYAGLMPLADLYTLCSAAAVHHPVQMNKEGERKTTPAILLCDDHQGCCTPYCKQRHFDLYSMKGARQAGRACHDSLHALQSEGGRGEGRQGAYASELHSLAPVCEVSDWACALTESSRDGFLLAEGSGDFCPIWHFSDTPHSLSRAANFQREALLSVICACGPHRTSTAHHPALHRAAAAAAESVARRCGLLVLFWGWR